MKKFVLLLSIGLIIFSCKKVPIDFNSIANDNLIYPNFDLHKSSWIKLDSLYHSSLIDIHFYNENVGITTSFLGPVFVTKDGGTTWRTISRSAENSFTRVYALGENTFLALARSGVFKSNNSGLTWDKLNFPSDLTYEIWFKDFNIGFISSVLGLYRTTDGGESWVKVSSVIKPLNMQFTSENIGYLSWGYTSYPDFGPGPAFSNGEILRTLDRGKSWNSTKIKTKEITGLSFISDKIGFFTTYDGELYKTMDGGESSAKIETPLVGLRNIYFINEQQGYLLARDGLYSTTDGGKTFNSEYSISEDIRIYRFYFPTPDVGFSYDSHGFVLKRIQVK